MFVDSSLARGLAKNHLTEWSTQGSLLRKKFEQIIGDARSRLRSGASPAKCVNRTLGDLSKFFSQSPGAGSIVETHGRRSEFTFICPASTDDGLAFSIIAGCLNGRSGELNVKVTRPLLITLHALERLHQRIGVTEPTEILSEIYGVVKMCAPLIHAAKQVGAQSCPLLSKRGLFVTAPTINKAVSTLVTWMPFDQLSRKWGTVADALRAVSENRPELLDDRDFLVEFLKSFRWMLKPHKPGIDMEAIAWRQESPKASPGDTAPPLISEISLTAIEADLALQEEHKAQSLAEVEIEDLLPEINCLSDPPTFKVNDRFVGPVVRITRSGYVIVSLLNGWFGSIPPIGLARANRIVRGLGDLSIGDKISVEVRKLYLSTTESTWGVSLDLSEKIDAEWGLVEVRYPKGEDVECVVTRVFEHRCYVQLADGVVAELPKKELSWSDDPEYEGNTLTSGQVVRARVVGSSQKRRHLVVSKRQASFNPWEDIKHHGVPDGRLTGVVFKVSASGIHLRLSLGVDGLIRPENAIGDESLCIGQIVNVEIIRIDHENSKISLALERGSLGPYKFLKAVEATADEWERIQVTYPVGSIVQGQVSRFLSMGTGIVLSGGPMGYLPDEELSWLRKKDSLRSSLQLGQLLQLVVIGLDANKRRLTFSHRQCTVSPWDDPEICPVVGNKYKGVVSNIVDFGAFIKLPGGLEGLLHQSEIPSGWQIEYEQDIDVIVTAVDREEKRIRMALALPKN